MAAPIVVIAGGSGFLGVSLATHLAAAGSRILIVSRHPPRIDGPWRRVTWDSRRIGPWARELDGAAGLVNLVGPSVDCVKNARPQGRDPPIPRRGDARTR